MRRAGGLVLALLVVLAGCNTAVMGPETTTGGGETGSTDVDMGPAPPDPEGDAIGWENGYWYNETLPVTNLDGLNESEREAVVARAMARIEYVRDTEFESTVPVEVISRETYRQRTSRNYTDRFRTFDNAKFEALFLVGEDRDSIAVQRANQGESVLGYYDTGNDTITLISESGQPVLDGEGTLAHELVHALQDQRFNLSSLRASTRDGVNAQNGLIEGEANFVQRRYTTRCGEEWTCLEKPDEESSPPDLHYGIYFMQFFPYSDGPTLVRDLYRQGGWDAVDRAFRNPPASAEQVIYPERYALLGDADEPTAVELSDSNAGGWERVRPEPQRSGHRRPDYATVGQSALSSMFIYTSFAARNRPLVARNDIVNVDSDGNVNRSDPFNYDLSYTSGWDGDRLHVYRNPDAGENETAYVWRLAWDSPQDASEFVEGYRLLLEYWGGVRVDGRENTWRIEDSPFADAFYVQVDGDTVTIVNAPTVDALGDVYAEYGGS
jgi:hypothetical protein